MQIKLIAGYVCKSLADDAVFIDGTDYLPVGKPNSYKDYELIYYINDVTIDNEEVLVEYGAAGTATGTYEYGLQRLSVESVNEAKEYYLYNGTGNVTQTTAENGSMFLRYTYDPFGNVTSINAPMTVDIDDLNRYTYNGEDYDYNTGLQYLRARYYSTNTGNFISQDTYLGDILNPLSQHRYTYVQNCPVMFVDPSGHFLLTAIIVGAVVGATVSAAVTTYDAATDGGTKDFSFSNIDGDDGWRIAKNTIIGGLVGGTAGGVGAVVGTTLAGAVGTTALGATGGVMLTVGQSIGVGIASSVSAGVAGRAANALWHNIFYPNEAPQNALAAAFDPMATLTDLAFGAVGGALTHYATGGYYPDPYKNGTGNKSYLDDVAKQADDARNSSNCKLDELIDALDDADGDASRTPRISNVTGDSADDAFKVIDDGVEESTSTPRPTWRQSELDAANDFPDYDAQKSFINGEEVPYGTKGSVRPDYYKDGFSVVIKNYNVESASGRSDLARNIEKQYYQRIKNLPDGTKQSVMIDVRGQNVSEDALNALYEDIMQRTNNGVEVLFKTD